MGSSNVSISSLLNSILGQLSTGSLPAAGHGGVEAAVS